MPAPANIHRSPARSVKMTFRCSPAEHEYLRQRALDAGVSLQAYLERLLLDRPDAQDRPSGPTRSPALQEELAMTG